MIATGTTPPTVNQVEFNPAHYRRALADGCWQQGVLPEAYSSLGTGQYLSHPTVKQVSEGTGRTPAQVLLRWCLQHDLVVIPKCILQKSHQACRLLRFA